MRTHVREAIKYRIVIERKSLLLNFFWSTTKVRSHIRGRAAGLAQKDCNAFLYLLDILEADIGSTTSLIFRFIGHDFFCYLNIDDPSVVDCRSTTTYYFSKTFLYGNVFGQPHHLGCCWWDAHKLSWRPWHDVARELNTIFGI